MLAKLSRILLLIMIVLALAACAQNDENDVDEYEAAPAVPEENAAAPSATPVPPTAVPQEQDNAAPTVPLAAEEEVAAIEPTATAVPTVPAPQRFGLLRFRDSDTASAGNFRLLMEGVNPAPVGSHYELWLIDDSFNTLNLGSFAANSSVEFAGSADQNLLGSFNAAFISIEPDGDTDGEIGTIAFEGTIPAGSLLHIRHLVTAFPANPDGKAFVVGAREQIHHALEHAGFLQDELANDNIREAQRHAEHVINILDGENGPNFGDLDGDTVPQNPGDGFGVRAYLTGAQEHTNLATAAEGATAEVNLHAGHVLISTDNALGHVDAAITEALRVIASDSAAEAGPAADELGRLLNLALNGQDANGDGAVAPIADEGGILTAYEHAQNMGSFEFFAADAAVAAPAPAAGETTAPVPEAAEAAPAATAAPPPPPVTVEMANFAYQPGDITVPVGTTVTWVNTDNGPRHSATAADGSFDTGLLDAGQEGSFTFDTPGAYVYYCTLHGSPDGSGMATTVTVTDS